MNETGFRIGLQLYSLKEDCAKDFPGTVADVAAMGFEGVEFAGYFGRSAAELKRMLDDNGLAAAGTHIPLATLQGDALKASADFNAEIGNSLLIVPGLPAENRADLDAWRRTADLFNSISRFLAERGLRTGYHNHTVEFVPMDGRVPLEEFYSRTDPAVVMQLDLGLAVEAGADPVRLLKLFPSRGVSIHAKEYSSADPDALLGDGQVPWPDVVRTCRATAGTRWFILEYERPRGTPLENVRLCLQNFRKILSEAGVPVYGGY